MALRMKGLIIGVFCIVACRSGHSQTPPPELWYWHHSYLTNASALQSSKALIDQAYAAGYTGVAFWEPCAAMSSSCTNWPCNRGADTFVCRAETRLISALFPRSPALDQP